jgi:hypothetical protein
MVRFKAKIRVVLKRDANEIRDRILALLGQLAFFFRLSRRTYRQSTHQYDRHHDNRPLDWRPFDLKSHPSLLSVNLSPEK